MQARINAGAYYPGPLHSRRGGRRLACIGTCRCHAGSLLYGFPLRSSRLLSAVKTQVNTSSADFSCSLRPSSEAYLDACVPEFCSCSLSLALWAIVVSATATCLEQDEQIQRLLIIDTSKPRSYLCRITPRENGTKTTR